MPHTKFAFACQVARVEIDPELGMTELTEYLMPTMQELPRNYERIILEYLEESGPYGAKGIGEITLVPTAPAIAAAVHQAVGFRPTKLPIKPQNMVTVRR